VLYRRIVEAILPYSKRHPETQTDAKLIWTGLKHHLSKPEHFHDMVATARGHHHAVEVQKLPISQKLKHKYGGKLDSIHFSHSPTEQASVNLGKSKGGTNFAELHMHHVHGLGIHPEETKNPKKVSHHKFMSSLRGNFDTFMHEFTHVHDHVIKGRNVTKGSPEASDHSPEANHKYYNSWGEVHARKNQLAYKMDKVLGSNPSIKHLLKGKPLTGDHMAAVGEKAKHNSFSFSNKASWAHGSDKTRRTYAKIFRQVAAKHGLKVKHE